MVGGSEIFCDGSASWFLVRRSGFGMVSRDPAEGSGLEGEGGWSSCPVMATGTHWAGKGSNAYFCS